VSREHDSGGSGSGNDSGNDSSGRQQQQPGTEGHDALLGVEAGADSDCVPMARLCVGCKVPRARAGGGGGREKSTAGGIH
jgi:hypothetical protein